MAECTPRKSVQWAGDNQVNEFVYGTPYSEVSSVESVNSTSTFQYINSQLVSHGFAHGSGVSFDGLSKEDAEKLSKCMLGMLSQRMEDMSRSEELTTKLRTLLYEQERLSSMHRTTSEQLSAAEKETSLFKSKLAAANKNLQVSDIALKTSNAELQKTRSSMQSLRQTHNAELKRRERETEKILDRWQKISDTQTKVNTTSTGLRFKTTFAHPSTSSRDSETSGKRLSIVEDALDEAETARRALIEENMCLKNIVLSAANELARLVHVTRARTENVEQTEVPRYTLSDLFSIAAPESANEKFTTLLLSFRDAINRLDGVEALVSPASTSTPSDSQTTRRSDKEMPLSDKKELKRLQNIIVDLQRQLEQVQTQRQSEDYANQAQNIIRRFVNEDGNDKANVHERQLLEKIRKELDKARKKVDEASLALRDEKAMLEEERQAFKREQHLWRSQMCIPQEDEAPKPITGLASYFDAPAEPLDLPLSPRPTKKNKRPKSPKKMAITSPKKANMMRSPAKPIFAVGKMGKRARIGGTPKKPSGGMLGASVARPKVIPPVETEVIPNAPGLPSSSSSQSLIVPNAFVLPPPSPMTSIPPQQAGLLSSKESLDSPDFEDVEDLSDEDQREVERHLRSSKPFPVAKPLAQHMIHAYSPARPSPLSRILMLANSPKQGQPLPENRVEENERNSHKAGSYGGRFDSRPESNTLEEELGIEETSNDLEESPLRAKTARMASKGKVPVRSSGQTSRDKMKGRSLGAKPPTNKENGTMVSSIPPVRQSVALKAPLAGKGGARRVPIGSADAAPIGRGWK